MMKKGVLILMIFLIGLFLTGCNGGNSSPKVPTYNTGSKGITLNLLENSPPTRAYHGGNIPIFLEVRNEGSESTRPLVWVSGHDPNIIRLRWEGTSQGVIQGKSSSNPTGGIVYFEENNVGISLPNNVDVYDTTLKFTTCYSYVTKSSAQVCVDPDPTTNDDDACFVKTVSTSGGQGGPVAITSIKEEPSADGTVVFTISIQNIGDGTIIDKSKISSCTSGLKESDLNVVSIRNAKIGYDSLSCSPGNPVRLVNGKGTIYCKKSGLSGEAYTTLLNLELDYGYKSSITKTLNVRRV